MRHEDAAVGELDEGLDAAEIGLAAPLALEVQGPAGEGRRRVRLRGGREQDERQEERPQNRKTKKAMASAITSTTAM